jgi:hypothetical protein
MHWLFLHNKKVLLVIDERFKNSNYLPLFINVLLFLGRRRIFPEYWYEIDADACMVNSVINYETGLSEPPASHES